MALKTCTKCNQVKELKEFTIDRQKVDGLYPQCRDCRSKYTKSEEYRKRDRARYPTRAEKLKEYLRKKYAEAPEKFLLKSADYRHVHADRHRKCSLAWQKNNPEKAQQIRKRYKSKKALATPTWLTKKQWEKINLFNLTAQAINKIFKPTDTMTVDHIVPLQGRNVSGLNVPWNLQLLPLSMNAIKGSKERAGY